MNPTTHTNQRLIIALLVAIAILLALLAIGIIGVFAMMSGGMMGMGGTMNGRMMSDMYAACTEIMKNIH